MLEIGRMESQRLKCDAHRSYVIRLFFRMCFAIVLTGLFAGLAVVPCVLGKAPSKHADVPSSYAPLTDPDSDIGLELNLTTPMLL